MIWQGRELDRLDQIVTAMSLVDSPHEAAKFRAAYAETSGEHPERDLGYLTGYMAPGVGARVLGLFGLEHPVIGDLGDCSHHELFTLGMEFQAAQVEGLEFEAAAARAR